MSSSDMGVPTGGVPTTTQVQTKVLKGAIAKGNAAKAAQNRLAATALENKARQVTTTKTLEKDQKKQGSEETGKTKKSEKEDRVEKTLLRKEEAGNQSSGFSDREGNRDYQLPKSALTNLALKLQLDVSEGGNITPTMDFQSLITLVRKELESEGKKIDPSQIDKAFEFLLEVTLAQKEKSTDHNQIKHLGDLYIKIAEAKIKHFELNAAAIQSAFVLIGPANVLLTPETSTAEVLDHLRQMVENPQDAQTKYDYYTKTRGQNYKTIKLEFKLLFTYMGSSVKKKDLEKPHLKQLLEEIKVLQAILGVYLQSKKEASTMLVHLDKVLGLFDE